MASKLINLGRKTKASDKDLNANQRMFCREYVANGMVGVEAYLTAYTNCNSRNAARVKALGLLKRTKVRAFIETLLQEDDDYDLRRAQLIAKDRRLNDFNPLEELCTFTDGYLCVTQENMARISHMIGDCVTECEVVTEEEDDGSVRTRFRIKLMDKNKAHERERKYHGLQDVTDGNVFVNVNQPTIDWDALCEGPNGELDVVEGKILGKGGNK